MSWYVVRTNIKCERKAEHNLRAAGFPVYLPIARTERVHKKTRRLIQKEWPLLGRHLFVRVDDAKPNWFGLRQCEGVESVLGINGRPSPVKQEDVVRLMLRQRSLEFDETTAALVRRGVIKKGKHGKLKAIFTAGSKVRVDSGPFTAFYGTVTRVDTRGDIEAMIEIFGRMTDVTFSADQLQPIDEKAKAA